MATEAATSRPSRAGPGHRPRRRALLLLGAVSGRVNAGTADVGCRRAARPWRVRSGDRRGRRPRLPARSHGRPRRGASRSVRRPGGGGDAARGPRARRRRRDGGDPTPRRAPPSSRTAGRGARRCRCSSSPLLALAGLFALGLAAFGRSSGTGRTARAGALTHRGPGPPQRTRPTGDQTGLRPGRRPRCSMCAMWSASSAEPLSGPGSSSDRAPVAPRCSSSWRLKIFVAEPHQRVVLAVDDALLHRDHRVVGDLDVLGADLGAALGDVAVPEAVLLLGVLLAVARVERVHVQLGDPHEEPRARRTPPCSPRGRGRRGRCSGTGSTRCTCGTPASARRRPAASGTRRARGPPAARTPASRAPCVVERHVGDQVADRPGRSAAA